MCESRGGGDWGLRIFYLQNLLGISAPCQVKMAQLVVFPFLMQRSWVRFPVSSMLTAVRDATLGLTPDYEFKQSDSSLVLRACSTVAYLPFGRYATSCPLV